MCHARQRGGYVPFRNIPNFVSNRFTDNETSLLLSTAEFLRFNVDRADTVFVPGHVNVRYCPDASIPCFLNHKISVFNAKTLCPGNTL